MNYMLDTNILIYLLKRQPPAVAQRINALDAQDGLCMSFVTYAELLQGAERSQRKAQARQQIAALVRLVPVLYQTGPDLCSHYARHAAQLRQAGTPIGGNDLWIASHALAQDCTLVTNNQREFQRVQGLRLENWADLTPA